MTQALEQMLGNEIVPSMGQDRMYATIDTYAAGTTALYSFDPPKPIGAFGTVEPDFGTPGGIRPIEPTPVFGLQTSEPYLGGYNIGENLELHLHGSDEDHITHGHIQDNTKIGKERVVGELNGYDASMAALLGDLNGWKKY